VGGEQLQRADDRGRGQVRDRCDRVDRGGEAACLEVDRDSTMTAEKHLEHADAVEPERTRAAFLAAEVVEFDRSPEQRIDPRQRAGRRAVTNRTIDLGPPIVFVDAITPDLAVGTAALAGELRREGTGELLRRAPARRPSPATPDAQGCRGPSISWAGGMTPLVSISAHSCAI
jgi:hypothetical protein